MRIIGYIDHPQWKITVFKTDTRVSVKFEDGLLEQTYKFVQQDQLNDLTDIKHLVDPIFLRAVAKQFGEMRRRQEMALARYLPTSEEDEFDVII